MINLARLSLEKIPHEIRSKHMTTVASFIKEHTQPDKLIFFGSVTTDLFDACSDIDVVAVYPDLESATLARRKLYGSPRPEIGHNLDILCVDRTTYDKKSQIGGVFFIAAESGTHYQSPS